LARTPEGLDSIMLPHSGVFSSSELVRFALIRTVLAHPGLILLDRSLDGLDDQGLQYALDILKALGDSTTVLTVTNRLEVLNLFKHRFELLNGGLTQLKTEALGLQLVSTANQTGGIYVTDREK
jgi:ABC-type molybdenum transport system ATPase subunit/photorepair protein PhrA